MKTIMLTGRGGPEVLEMTDTVKPSPQAGELLVRVSAIGINYANVLIRQGVYMGDHPLPFVMMAELEGVIEAVGEGVTGMKPGQRVTGVAARGYAEYATLRADETYLLPDDLPHGQGLLAQGLTARYLLAQAQGYRSVLITAAAGGVGSFAIQLAKQEGATNVIGLVGDKSKIGFVNSLGADHCFSYLEEGWQQLVSQATGGTGTDLILDAIGGDISTALLPQLSTNGTMITYGNTSGKPVQVDGNLLSFKAGRIKGASIMNASREDQREWFYKMIGQLKKGELKTTLTFFPFEKAVEAYRAIDSRIATGKIVLSL
ncbi:quinone oxidoreductase family protein [Chitinophaga barathri]|nr:zinc-binding alcohol dehydrogenase family protein [Chitinophaga barathri]